ncbi:hypothetical protein ACJMK2_007178 [Sinanodonta woodiana]|uniref:NXPE C-terminal domain-containing protein n=1 Tax=Sinanodonta woodiana TaxID=1069815 RepID=A0ABD3VIU8_SINWO
MTVSNASKSKFVILNQKQSYRLGEEIRVHVDLYDGYGHKRTIGGDMVRVWMRETTLNASAAARVRDNGNGSYTATLITFWLGAPEIKVVLIHPKEVIDTSFRRRFTCPQVLHQLAVFEHPVDSSINESTVCNIDEYIPGYTAICNLTHDNYGSPLYCGKPANRRLQCSDWTRLRSQSTWPNNEPHLTSAERLLLQPENKATFLPGSISIQVNKAGTPRKRLIESSSPCSKVDRTSAWNRSSPIGYFYNGIWYDRHCTRRLTYQDTTLNRCLGNRSIYLLGDSTVRQWHYVIQDRINCTFITDTWDESHKHRPVTCVDRNLNFTLHFAPHGLPFVTDNTPRRYFRPIASNIDDIKGDNHVIILVHLFAHMVSFHSNAFYNKMHTIKNAIKRLYQRSPSATVAIKGPHYYSFGKQTYQSLWMLDKYAEIYTNLMRELFGDIADRVIYLDGMDITIAAETKHIHPTRETVVQMVDDMFSKICS